MAGSEISVPEHHEPLGTFVSIFVVLVANHCPLTRRGELLQLLADYDVCHDGAPSFEIECIVISFAKDHMNRDVRPFQPFPRCWISLLA